MTLHQPRQSELKDERWTWLGIFLLICAVGVFVTDQVFTPPTECGRSDALWLEVLLVVGGMGSIQRVGVNRIGDKVVEGIRAFRGNGRSKPSAETECPTPPETPSSGQDGEA